MAATDQRNHEIVEELRADIDFEIDDVIAQIVRGLPEEYFRTLSRSEQLKHLKALLALNVCNVNEEIRMRSDDGRYIAVVARRDYPGLLANILKQLPSQPPLVGAKVFTSRDHDFIIDLFEFESDSDSAEQTVSAKLEIEELIQEVIKQTGDDETSIRGFVNQYPSNSPVFDSSKRLIEQYRAYGNFIQSGETTIEFSQNQADYSRITIASGAPSVLSVFTTTAEFLAEKGCDIQQALLNEFTSQQQRVAVAGIRIAAGPTATENMVAELKACLAKH